MTDPRFQYGRADGQFWWLCSSCNTHGDAPTLSLAYIAAREHLETCDAVE
jgi:hypothetical protein